MRFHAPARGEVDSRVFDHPLFTEFQSWRGWLDAEDWSDPAELSVQVAEACRAAGIPSRELIVQDSELLADGLHYELRIAQQGRIPTRRENWHDLLNALIWLRHPRLKQAMNQRQVADIARVGVKQRTRGQCALTHFDEAGIVLLLRDSARIEAWDRHDWPGLFLGLEPDDWAISIVGHALLEHGLERDRLLVGKALVVDSDDPRGQREAALADLASAIASGRLLCDPQELRPLPLMGLPGWHCDAGDRAFLLTAPCFQPRRAERRYPAPQRLNAKKPVKLDLCPALPAHR